MSFESNTIQENGKTYTYLPLLISESTIHKILIGVKNDFRSTKRDIEILLETHGLDPTKIEILPSC